MQKKNEDSIRQEMSKEIHKLDTRLQEVETSSKQQDDKMENQLRQVS